MTAPVQARPGLTAEDARMFASEYAADPHPDIELDVRARIEGNAAAVDACERYMEAVDNVINLQSAVDPYSYLPEEDRDLLLPIAYQRADETWESNRDAALADLVKAVE